MSIIKENTCADDSRSFVVDPRITYPCYKSFDDFIDIDLLRSLDGEVTEQIRLYDRRQNADLFLNLYRLDPESPYKPGVREIWLSQTRQGSPEYSLDMVDTTELWEIAPVASQFRGLMAFIETLPFARTGRMIVIYDASGKAVPAHRDHLEPSICNEFIWFRTNLRKPFYVLNSETNQKEYVSSYSAWFDAVNQYHGSEASDGLSFSIRVDGVFTDEFGSRIPRPTVNAASTPALWACLAQ
ncbi:MAG: hypothetical protein ABR530_06805 [Pyrinomonadaceae bacterium]